MISYTTRAAFWIEGKGWTWVKWTHGGPGCGNMHAAIRAKAEELGARGYDTGNADHYPSDRYPHATRS